MPMPLRDLEEIRKQIINLASQINHVDGLHQGFHNLYVLLGRIMGLKAVSRCD